MSDLEDAPNCHQQPVSTGLEWTARERKDHVRAAGQN